MNATSQSLSALGGLHDAIVVEIDWQAQARTLRIALDDIYANFRGMPEYPGRFRGEIVLKHVSQIDIAIESDERLRVFEILLEPDSSDTVTATFSPSGRIRARFSSADYPVPALSRSSPDRSA